MQRHHGQDGAALVMIIGVTVALAILAATLVAVTVNAQTGTSHDRMRAKAVDVAEGSIDASLSAMSAQWPATSGQAVDTTGPTGLQSIVRGLFPVGGLDGNPNPPAGQDFVRIYIYDNSDTNGDGKIDRLDAPYDSYADGVMNVEVQANVGGQRAGIVTQVTASKTTLDIAKTAIYAKGNLDIGGANSNKNVIGVAGSESGVTAITNGYFTSGGNDNALNFGCVPGLVTPVQDPTPTLYDMIPEMTLDVLQQKCFSTKAYPYRYYTSSAADTGYLGGVVVVDPPAGQYASVDLKNNTTSATAPGILIVTRGSVTYSGSGTYYGMIIVRDSPAGTDAFTLGGTTYFRGMVFVNGSAQLNGTGTAGDPNLLYDPAVAALLKSNTVVLKARVVPNTWRQVKPQ